MSTRKNFVLSDASADLLKKISALCDLKTETAVIKEALVLYGWAVTEAAQGRTIAAIDEPNKVVREITTPGLINSQRRPA